VASPVAKKPRGITAVRVVRVVRVFALSRCSRCSPQSPRLPRQRAALFRGRTAFMRAGAELSTCGDKMRECASAARKFPLRLRRFESFGGLKLVRAFEQAAEIFFAGDDFRAFLAGEAGRDLYSTSSRSSARCGCIPRLVPDLALAKFHGGAFGQPASPDPRLKRDSTGRRLFLPPAFCRPRPVFLLVGAVGFGLFLVRFLLVRLRGSIAHNFCFFSG